MATVGRFGLARVGLPDIDRPIRAAIDTGATPLGATETGATPLGAIDDAGPSNGVPRPVKRWRLLVLGGSASAFRESPPDQWASKTTPGSRRRRSSEFAARPAQPARSSPQARS